MTRQAPACGGPARKRGLQPELTALDADFLTAASDGTASSAAGHAPFSADRLCLPGADQEGLATRLRGQGRVNRLFEIRYADEAEGGVQIDLVVVS